MYNVQLRKDLEGFLNDLDKKEELNNNLSGEQLIESLTPKIDEYFEQYDNQFYNSERINDVKNNLLLGLPEYIKINTKYNAELKKCTGVHNLRQLGFGALWATTGYFLTGTPLFGIIGFFVGSSIGANRIPVTKEYQKLKKEREKSLLNFIR